MNCTHCGAPAISKSSLFCSKCGKPLNPEPEAESHEIPGSAAGPSALKRFGRTLNLTVEGFVSRFLFRGWLFNVPEDSRRSQIRLSLWLVAIAGASQILLLLFVPIMNVLAGFLTLAVVGLWVSLFVFLLMTSDPVRGPRNLSIAAILAVLLAPLSFLYAISNIGAFPIQGLGLITVLPIAVAIPALHAWVSRQPAE